MSGSAKRRREKARRKNRRRRQLAYMMKFKRFTPAEIETIYRHLGFNQIIVDEAII